MSQTEDKGRYSSLEGPDGAKHVRRDRKTARHKSTAKAGRRFFPAGTGYRILLLLMLLVAVAVLVALILMNSFPPDLTIAIVAVMMGFFFLAVFLMGRPKKWKRIAGIAVAAVFLVLFGATSYYLGTTYAALSRMSTGGFSNAETRGQSIDPTKEAFNLYITGIDQWESEKGTDLERSDVNMIMTVNPVTKKILLTSIPRDAYVKLHTAQQMDKLTHTGIYGVDETLNTVEDWMGIDLNYYVKMNFSGARNIITTMNGIEVYSPVEFDSDLTGYHYKKGWNTLSGKEALYFARERHAFEGQDSVRVENQQRVVKAIIKKLTTSPALLMDYGDIMAEAGDNLHTNMSYDEIRDLVKMQLSDLSTWDIETQKIEGEYAQETVASMSSANKYDVYKADPESVRKCREAIRETENPPTSELVEAANAHRKGFFANLFRRVTEKIKDRGNEETEEEA